MDVKTYVDGRVLIDYQMSVLLDIAKATDYTGMVEEYAPGSG